MILASNVTAVGDDVAGDEEGRTVVHPDLSTTVIYRQGPATIEVHQGAADNEPAEVTQRFDDDTITANPSDAEGQKPTQVRDAAQPAEPARLETDPRATRDATDRGLQAAGGKPLSEYRRASNKQELSAARQSPEDFKAEMNRKMEEKGLPPIFPAGKEAQQDRVGPLEPPKYTDAQLLDVWNKLQPDLYRLDDRSFLNKYGVTKEQVTETFKDVVARDEAAKAAISRMPHAGVDHRAHAEERVKILSEAISKQRESVLASVMAGVRASQTRDVREILAAAEAGANLEAALGALAGKPEGLVRQRSATGEKSARTIDKPVQEPPRLSRGDTSAIKDPRAVHPADPRWGGRQIGEWKSSVPIRESTGASPRGHEFQSASAEKNRAIATGPRADIGESHAYKEALKNREIGLESPQGTNVPGRADFITARENPDGTVTIIVTDVKTVSSDKSRHPTPEEKMPEKWVEQVRDAIGPSRLGLNNPVLEHKIREAFQTRPPRIELRQINVDFRTEKIDPSTHQTMRGGGQVSGL